MQLSIKKYWGICILIILSFASFLLSGIAEAASFLFAILIYSPLFYLLRVVYCRILKKDTHGFREFFLSYARIVGGILFVMVLTISIFGFYENRLSPAKLPAYTISNGEKTVIFRTMSHIASDRFYTEVAREVSSAREQWYVVFYEGVRPGSPENAKRFDEIFWMRFDADTYARIADFFGLVAQNTAMITSPIWSRDRNVDVSIDEIVAFFDRRVGSGQTLQPPATPLKNEDIQALRESLSSNELRIAQYINRALLSFTIKNRTTADAAVTGFYRPELFSAILDDRNKVITEEILASSEKKIFALYGLLHFDGIFDMLQERDHRWKVIAPPEYLFPTIP